MSTTSQNAIHIVKSEEPGFSSVLPERRTKWSTYSNFCVIRVCPVLSYQLLLNNSNNTNNHDSVYGAVIMTKVIATVQPVHLLNAD